MTTPDLEQIAAELAGDFLPQQMDDWNYHPDETYLAAGVAELAAAILRALQRQEAGHQEKVRVLNDVVSSLSEQLSTDLIRKAQELRAVRQSSREQGFREGLEKAELACWRHRDEARVLWQSGEERESVPAFERIVAYENDASAIRALAAKGTREGGQ